MSKVWVAINENDEPVEIFSSFSQAIHPMLTGKSLHLSLVMMVRSVAVKHIRSHVYARARGRCEKCNETLTPNTAHMDEKVSRGEGGNISLANSWILCSTCHIGPTGEHSNRLPDFRGGKNDDQEKEIQACSHRQ